MKSPARAALLAGSSVWCMGIIAAPLAKLSFVYLVFSMICHQDPARSWAIFGTALPVCIRCASIYFGFLGSLCLALPISVKWLRISIVLTITEFLLAQVFLDSAVLRSISGIAMGAAAAPFVLAGVQEMIENFRQPGGARARM